MKAWRGDGGSSYFTHNNQANPEGDLILILVLLLLGSVCGKYMWRICRAYICDTRVRVRATSRMRSLPGPNQHGQTLAWNQRRAIARLVEASLRNLDTVNQDMADMDTASHQLSSNHHTIMAVKRTDDRIYYVKAYVKGCVLGHSYFAKWSLVLPSI